MKSILVLFPLLCGYVQLIRAVQSPKTEEFAFQIYQMATEKVGSFFKTAGTPVTDSVHPSLRTEEAEIHPRATAHLTYYRDSQCTQVDYILDVKIGRCFTFLGDTIKPVITSEDDSTWTLAFVPYDASCEKIMDSRPSQNYPKNTCIITNDGPVTFNLIAHPLKSIPGGGEALVFYDNYNDCQISKHTNLARANMVATWRTDDCTAAIFGFYVKSVSCDSSSMKFNGYQNGFCTIPTSAFEISTDPAVFDCAALPDLVNYSGNFQALCIADSGMNT
jgi:hypothetical protein